VLTSALLLKNENKPGRAEKIWRHVFLNCEEVWYRCSSREEEEWNGIQGNLYSFRDLEVWKWQCISSIMPTYPSWRNANQRRHSDIRRKYVLNWKISTLGKFKDCSQQWSLKKITCLNEKCWYCRSSGADFSPLARCWMRETMYSMKGDTIRTSNARYLQRSSWFCRWGGGADNNISAAYD
jgi:hypothetical protein